MSEKLGRFRKCLITHTLKIFTKLVFQRYSELANKLIIIITNEKASHWFIKGEEIGL